MAIDEKQAAGLHEGGVEELGDGGVIQLKPQKRWTSYLWDTFDKSPKERRFLFKVDAAILTFASLGMFFEALFRISSITNKHKDILSNISINRISIMLLYLGCKFKLKCKAWRGRKLTWSRKEDLGLYGNQLNYMTTAWTVGYVIGEIPSNILLTRVRPSIWIPACEVTFLSLITDESC
jgi:MFS transporter, ACS family, pantothenate transporter